MPLKNALDFNRKTVLITGASDGIGYGIAQAFLEAGAIVHVTGTKSATDYPNDFTGMTFHSLNVADGVAIENLATSISELDVLINCVGTVLYKKQEFERAGFEKILTINLTGIMHLCMAFYPHLARSGGNVINLDSVVAIRPAINNPAYTASKAGLKQLTKGLAMRWGRKGIRVNAIAPGMVPTKLTANQVSAEQETAFKKRNPIKRFGTPQDMAGGALFLASPLAAYVTGQHLVIDGGMTI